MTKKRSILALAIAVGVTAVAVAYWSADGAGTGTGTTDSPTGGATLTVTAPNIAGVTYPGDSDAIGGTITNTNDYDVNVTTLTSDVTVTPAAGETCGADDNFEVTGLVLKNAQGDTVTAAQLSKGESVSYAGTFAFKETNVSQDGCKDADVDLEVAAR
ncbi:MAG TPA: hypothetical protein VGW75_09570 [Solirubrobacteraceae bacterium]|nr:hypothetical protein [Solirubrobacteraceae bacterium]